MAPVTRNVPRFLPTLTEVVHPPAGAPPLAHAAPPLIDPQALLQRVRTDVDLVLQTHLEATVANAMLDQVAVIVARIREELEPMVRQAVAEAVAAELDAAQAG
ncbi:MAG: hypothetical protein JNM97_03775 [Rhodoferax sp.]|jgi:hypothetical protein|nr:hypothetical protein [Rhodoferax sp.]